METKDIKTSSESSGASEAVAKPAKKSPPKWLLVAACLSFAPLTNTAGLIMPVLGTMQQSFAASGAVYPDWLVQCIQTSLMLSAFIMGLLFGPASKRFSLKTLGVAGIAITMVCNVVPGIFPQGGLWLFVIMRFLSGFGVGLVYGCNTSCIVANFRRSALA